MTVTATLLGPCPTARTVGVPPVVTSAPGSLSAKTRAPHQEELHSWHTLAYTALSQHHTVINIAKKTSNWQRQNPILIDFTRSYQLCLLFEPKIKMQHSALAVPSMGI